MSKTKALDLFCGAGGAAKGLERAGFTHIIGVDNTPQPNYPYRFYLGNAIKVLNRTNQISIPINRIDLIWASPPCQAYTPLSNKHRGNDTVADDRPHLVTITRQLLDKTGVPYIIENVPGAPLKDPVSLHGNQFGLGVHRPRLFESNIPLAEPLYAPRHPDPVPVYGKLDGRLLWRRKDGSELRQAIPPAYAEYLGRQVIDYLGR